MEPISTMSHEDLVRGRELVVRKLEEREPVLMLELRLYDTALAAYGSNSGPPKERPYVGIRQPKTAILSCLKRNGRWMTRFEIMRDLEEGGYANDRPESFDKQISEAISFHFKLGRLSCKDENGNIVDKSERKPDSPRLRNERYGLPEWNEKPAA